MQCFNGPSLNKHYELLCDFIITNKMTDSYSFFEVGGSYGRLAKLIINYYKDKDNNVNNYTSFNYQILEFNIEYYPSIENVEYISGNCESYEFKNTKTLIMSHVFEHLYDPRLFLKKISEVYNKYKGSKKAFQHKEQMLQYAIALIKKEKDSIFYETF